jgi:hypothetical protein
VTEDYRIREIRAVLDEYPAEWNTPSLIHDRIRAILDSAPPAPRVFFPGDTVPAGVAIQDYCGDVHRSPTAPWVLDPECWDGPAVEISALSDEVWQAAVDRARTEREEALRADRHAEITEAEASEARDG